MRVTTVDDDVALLKTAFGEESLDELVDSFSGLDEEHHSPWLLKSCYLLADDLQDTGRRAALRGKVGDRMSAHYGLS